ncbi:hypothetical protein OB03_12530 [Brevundimonas sp. GN22]
MYKIGFRIDGQTVVLSSDDSVRHAMLRGDLRRDTRVFVEDDDREVFVGPAEDFGWLKARFEEVFPAPVVTEAEVVEEQPEVVAPAPAPVASEDKSPAEEPVQPPVSAAAGQTPQPAEPQLNVAPVARASTGKSSTGPVLALLGAFVGIVVFVFWMVDNNRSYEPYEAVQSEPAAVAEAEPAYPVLETGRMYSFPQTPEAGRVFQVGDLLVELSSAYTDGYASPVLKLTDPEGQVFALTGDGQFEHAEFGVGDLDGGGRADDLIFTSFSGGAHCCYAISVATKHNGQWRNVDFGMWDGAGLDGFPTNLGGDAAPEFRAYDNSFLYAFASYAESAAPVQILKLRGGQMVDVSTDRAYRQEHVNRMAQLEPSCRNGQNGACAAYLASAARAGSMSPAWAVMLQSYTNTDWILPTACLIPTNDACPASMEVAFETYPEALQHFLGEREYASQAYVSGKQWNGKPSFDCTGNLGEVLGLVCDTPYLRMLDHQLAQAYTKAMAFSRDRIALQRTQQEWIALRNSQPADLDTISYLYQARISQLTGN